ncbi:diguanylate cyclase [uncultured Pseudodesulfovibrio sp.]|uniref:diguanylate cyclase n=1 Tax=uncultured Pseudodesulfovibrio sp. TaxID=2035858 RepID=UPI0029C95D95|nr:diguanylate cyclase [uncultured Pseudodesulfovibrio sp.]
MRLKFTIYLTVLFLLLFSVDLVLQELLLRQFRSQQVVDVSQRIAPIRVGIEKEIVNNLLLIQGTANYISVHPDITAKEFRLYAQGALQGSNLLRNLGAAPDLIMRFVYPLRGNENVIGINYRDLPNQWPQVQLAMRKGSMVVAGPINLVQGGRGLVGRAPVFINKGSTTDDGRKESWGIVSAVLDIDRLFLVLEEKNISDLRIAIRGKDGKGAQGKVFSGDEILFNPSSKAILSDIFFPSGSWQMAVLPKSGWPVRHPLSGYVHLAFLLFFFIFLYLGYRDLRQRIEVSQGKMDLDEAQAIAHLGNWSYTPRTDVVEWSEETYRIFGVDKSEFTPSLDAFFELVHPADRERMKNAYWDSIKSRERLSIDHRIIRPDGSVRYVHEQGENRYDGGGELIRSFGTVHDTTNREVIAKELAAEQAKIQAMAEATYDPLIMIDAEDTILFWSPAAEKVLGWTSEEVVGQKMHPLITPEEYLKPAQEGLKQFATTGRGPVLDSIMEFPAIRKDGQTFPAERSVSAFQVDGEFFAVGMLRDITDRKKTEGQLELMANTDELTGIYNRRYFIEQLEVEFLRSRRYKTKTSLILFDADNFKKINDTYGHDVGDEVLVYLTKAAKENLREVDCLARFGGEEFIILLPETHLKDALIVAERIRSFVEQAEFLLDDGAILHFTVSLGVTEIHGDEEGHSQVIKRADTAMYRAKQTGRNKVESE